MECYGRVAVTQRFTQAAMSAAFPVDSGRSRDDDETAGVDPKRPFDLTSPGADNGHSRAASA